MLSQSPKLIHSDARQFINRHIHLVSKWSGRKEYEWAEIQENTKSRGDAVERSYKLPKHVYKFYKSAEVHTKVDKRKPISFYVAICSVVMAVLMAGYGAKRIHDKTVTPVAVAAATDRGEGVGASSSGVPAVQKAGVVASALSTFPDFKPVLDGVPESAPAYSDLVKVTSVPIMMGCVQNKKTEECKCYTAQATVYQTSKAYCLETIANHRFNPYLAQASNDKSNDKYSDKSSPL